MRIGVKILLLIILAGTITWGWYKLAFDPGYVMVQLHNVTLETSLVFAILFLGLSWAVLYLAIKLLGWPFLALSKRARRNSKKRLSHGLLAFYEGRYPRAIRYLSKAASHAELKAPALLVLAQAAYAHGEYERAFTALDQIKEEASDAAIALRACFLADQEKVHEAIALLKDYSKNGKLPPSASKTLIALALRVGDHEAALESVGSLQKNRSLATQTLFDLQSRVFSAVLLNAPDMDQLNALWNGISRAQRRLPELLQAYARRAVTLGQPLAGISELEAGLRKQWSETLALCYGELGDAEAALRLRNAESWLKLHPDSHALLLALGRLCCVEGLWGKAQVYLERALEMHETSSGWEALAECYQGQDSLHAALICYQNALRVARGEPSQPIDPSSERKLAVTQAAMTEERSEHGVPRLGGSVKS